MQRSAIAILGLMVGFAVLVKATDRAFRADREAAVGLADPQPIDSLAEKKSATLEEPHSAVALSPWQSLTIDDSHSEEDQDAIFQIFLQGAEEAAKLRMEEHLKAVSSYSRLNEPFPSWGGAIIRNFSYGENGEMTEYIVWGRRRFAYPIDW